MRCPTCAEKVFWVRLFGRKACPHCRLALRFTGEGAPISLGLQQARFLLDGPRSRSDTVFFVIGTVVTGLLSLFPAAGLLTGLVLPLVQVYCIERSTRRFREHFDFLHGLSHDLVSGMLFLALVAVEGASGTFLGSLAAAVNLPVFVLAWWAIRALAKGHLRRVADGRRPHTAEIGALYCSGALLTGPPIILAIVLFANAVFGSSGPGPHTASPNELLEILGTGAVLALDLFLLPLWACVALVTFGFVDNPSEVLWISSWWMFGLVTVALGVEVLLDNGLDRRMRFSRTTWPRIQYLLTPFTLLAVVLILGQDLPWRGKAVAFFGALFLSGLIRFGGTETVKTTLSLFPGTLAQRKALLYTAPLRIAAALAIAYLAHYAPIVVVLMLSALALFASVFLTAHFLIRLRARKAERITCRTCGYRAHEMARLCPACHEPVMSSRILDYPPEVRKAILEIGTAIAWADGTIDAEESRILESTLRASGLPEQTIDELAERLSNGLSIDQIAIEDIPPRHHDQLLAFAATLAAADYTIDVEERDLWQQAMERMKRHNTGKAQLLQWIQRLSGR